MARGPAELPRKLAAYVQAVGVRETAVQRRLRAVTRRLPRGSMQIGPDQAAFMQVLVRAIGAKRCLEVGTFTGYSSLAVALALPDNGKLVCCDVSEEYTAVARKHWDKAGVAAKIELRLGPAIDTLDALIKAGGAGKYDFMLIDADKTGYDSYFERGLTLLRAGGLFVFDNVLWGGAVLESSGGGADTRALRALNNKLASDERVDVSMLPVGDGLTLARKR